MTLFFQRTDGDGDTVTFNVFETGNMMVSTIDYDNEDGDGTEVVLEPEGQVCLMRILADRLGYEVKKAS